MSNTLVEAYVLFSGSALFKFAFPFNLAIWAMGLFFGFRRASSWLTGAICIALKRAGSFSRTVWQTKEPLGLYGAILSTSMAILTLISFMRDSDELELLLRCDRTDDFSVADRYVLISARCAVKNGGNVTATIDTVEPTFYFSKRIDLARGLEDRSIHSFRGDPSELLSKDFALPQTLQPGVTKIFNAKVAIPIGWWEKTQTDDGLFLTTQDIELLLSEFAACKETERPEECFYEMTGKYLPNYLYETIKYPGGMGGYQPINGVGIRVSDFSYSAEVEVDLYTGLYPRRRKEDNELLSDDRSFSHLENLRRPWWKKEYIIWTQTDEKSRSGFSTNFMFATLKYLSVALSIFGWLLIGNRLWRKTSNRAHNAEE
ncbi:hypothetical protein KUV26_21790 [Leisingera daeponensis]|uniref:Transmembrane protein n=1 Tax=Leisingera daeponensis TaxID=405746 RepID=A0ABS7NLJ9_9RHOB|nr:hypothetical protein [Leisingera daeponensis]MBY6142075.1 hypothetical protein [Leisingera daeponensis]